MIKQTKLELIYGQEIASKILSSNLLVVGAGGIGCELLKTLSIAGFKKATIVRKISVNLSKDRSRHNRC